MGKIEEREGLGVRTGFEWIKGHANNKGNVEADRLAVDGARKGGAGGGGRGGGVR